MAARLGAMAHTLTGGRAAAEDALCNYQACNSKDITETAATVEVTLVAKTVEACFAVGGRFVPETGITAAANSRDLQLEYDDGAGGAPTTLATLWDGTASTSLAGKVNELAGVKSTTEIPAGSRIYANCTHNGTGIAWDETMFEVDLERA
jgi:hypothetical protein